MVQTFGPGEVGHKFHVKSPTPKHVENSIRGSKRAKRRGYKTNDLDMLPDVVLRERAQDPTPMTFTEIEGHIRNAHWPDCFRHDGFRDPKGILEKGDLLTEMHPHEIDRLVAGHFPRYHIPTIEQQLALCGDIHLQALLEPKGKSRVWRRQEVWDYLAHVAEQNSTKTAVYCLNTLCLPYARAAGFAAWKIR